MAKQTSRMLPLYKAKHKRRSPSPTSLIFHPFPSLFVLTLTELLRWPFEHLPLGVLAAALGLLTGAATFFWVRRALADCGLESPRGEGSAGQASSSVRGGTSSDSRRTWTFVVRTQRTPLLYGLIGTLIGAAFTVAVLAGQVQQTPEVRPSLLWHDLRIVYHLSLIVGLLAVTATDLQSFYISNRVLYTGIAIGLSLAVLSGDLQLAHVWVDWNQEIPQMRGPYLPQWLSLHPHLHGLAWSAAGILSGVLLAGGTRLIGAMVLAQPVLGTGDVYLMAMIGAYLGWQPTVMAFLIAPMIAVVVGASMKLLFNRPALPYGPFLAAGALVVLGFWRSIWMLEIGLGWGMAAGDRASTFALRRLFGDPVALATVCGIALVSLLGLLGLIRLYRTIPVGSRSTNSDGR